MHPSVLRVAAAFLLAGAVAFGCAVEGPDEPDVAALTDSGAAGGAGGAAAAGGDGSSSNSGGEDDTGPPSGSGGSAGGDGSGSGAPGNCSLTSSNPVCADCLAEKCCMVINKCMDADLLGCVACIDCFLEGKGADCCDETVGKNIWIEECVAWNCDTEC